ncbi:hypothetical protein GW750_06805 [bacterium]|nr:hypothetical protein [bacterium]
MVYTCFSSLLQSCADEQNIVTKQQTFEFLIQSLAKLALKQPNQVINHTMFQNEEGENLIVAIIKQLRIAGINVFPDNPNVIDSLPQEVKDTTITLPCVCIGVWNRQVIQSIP